MNSPLKTISHLKAFGTQKCGCSKLQISDQAINLINKGPTGKTFEDLKRYLRFRMYVKFCNQYLNFVIPGKRKTIRDIQVLKMIILYHVKIVGYQGIIAYHILVITWKNVTTSLSFIHCCVIWSVYLWLTLIILLGEKQWFSKKTDKEKH